VVATDSAGMGNVSVQINLLIHSSRQNIVLGFLHVLLTLPKNVGMAVVLMRPSSLVRLLAVDVKVECAVKMVLVVPLAFPLTDALCLRLTSVPTRKIDAQTRKKRVTIF
jgi:hypothetical protein